MPVSWKEADVTPIFKSGSKIKVNNYRPISLTSIICRTFEKLIKNKLVDHLEVNNLLHNSQHGFRQKKSCLTNLLEFFNKVVNFQDLKIPVDILYLDFAKAFDKVCHSKLIHKLKSYALGKRLIKWIEDWLCDRKQRVVLNGVKSKWCSVTSGVPQGSVLGPLLFIIYIDDLDVGLTNKIAKFADDTKLMGQSTSDKHYQSIKEDLKKLELWADQWDMEFNVNKCKVMFVGKKNSKKAYEMFGKPLLETEKEKDLGIVINNDMKVSSQCMAAYNKANRILGLISRNFSYKTIEIIRTLYVSLVRPHLEYCVQFWSPHFVKDRVNRENTA